MSEIALRVENLGKKYIIGHQKSGDLRGSVSNKLKNLFGRSDRSEEEFWALRDINFEVKQGEAVGIIGRNGAGKSTLLKILSRIAHPTTGRFEINGRVSSLLEVGTGFHQELTGRENIFLNGTILGMKRNEIKAKFDQIVEFSGVEQFLDTPVKHYSSGMTVRLAFSVAAHLEPEILIIDEVLAVGDAEFQKKCLGKMDEVSKNEGRTVLFVSHNLPSLKTICTKGMLIDKGHLKTQGDIGYTIQAYTQGHLRMKTLQDGVRNLRDGEIIKQLKINNSEEATITVHDRHLEVQFNLSLSRRLEFEFQMHIKKEDMIICSYSHFVKGKTIVYEPGDYFFSYKIDLPDLRSGNYSLDVCFAEAFVGWFANNMDGIELVIINESHKTFLNQESLNWWGSHILSGTFTYNRLS